MEKVVSITEYKIKCIDINMDEKPLRIKMNLFYVPQKKESDTHLERLEGKSFLDELSL